MENIEEVMTNPDVVYSVINAISDNFTKVLKEYCPNIENKNPYSHYMTGSCGEFAYMIYDIFQEYSSFYVNKDEGHVVMKIGEYYWDIRGRHTFDSLGPGYVETPAEYVEFDLMPFIRTDGTDKIITPHLTALAKERLNNILSNHGLAVETQKSL